MAALDEELAQRERQLSEQLREAQTAAAAQLSDAEVRAWSPVRSTGWGLRW